MFEPAVRDSVCQLSSEGAHWLATGPNGGFHSVAGATNITVPEGFERQDLAAYADERRSAAGFQQAGPALLTGVDQAHARAARSGSVTVVATAGLSNPATLPMAADSSAQNGDWEPGTVNLLVGTTRSLAPGTLATLLATAVEAKTATLQSLTGYTGTTSDAVAVGCDRSGPPAAFAGSTTPVGADTRRCVRDAVVASLDARYDDTPLPASVPAADHGVETTGTATVFDPN